jgi:hypothetical protein
MLADSVIHTIKKKQKQHQANDHMTRRAIICNVDSEDPRVAIRVLYYSNRLFD